MPLTFRRLQTSGTDLQQEYHLRDTILRIPLGLVFHLTPEQIRHEESDFHFGLFDSDNLCACVIATPYGPGQYKIRQMAVREDLQQQGLGRQLMLQTEQALRDAGANELTLHARDIATGFYEKLGYLAVGDWFTEVGIPHLKMCKALTD